MAQITHRRNVGVPPVVQAWLLGGVLCDIDGDELKRGVRGHGFVICDVTALFVAMIKRCSAT